MGRVTWPRHEALLRFPAAEGEDTMWRWLERFAGALTFSDNARLADAWFASDGTIVALLDAAQVEDFAWVTDETSKELQIPRDQIELVDLAGMRDRFAFMGDPTVPDQSLRSPRIQRWNRVDIGTDDRTLRIEYIHGIPDDLQRVEVYEDDFNVTVTIYLGWKPTEGGGPGPRGYVLVGIGGWAVARTKDPVGRRRILDGADL